MAKPAIHPHHLHAYERLEQAEVWVSRAAVAVAILVGIAMAVGLATATGYVTW